MHETNCSHARRPPNTKPQIISTGGGPSVKPRLCQKGNNIREPQLRWALQQCPSQSASLMLPAFASPLLVTTVTLLVSRSSVRLLFLIRDMVTLSVGDIVWAFGLILHTTRLTKFLFPPSVAFHLLCCFLSWWPLGFWRCGCAASGTKKNQTGKKRNKSTLNSVPPLV